MDAQKIEHAQDRINSAREYASRARIAGDAALLTAADRWNFSLAMTDAIASINKAQAILRAAS